MIFNGRGFDGNGMSIFGKSSGNDEWPCKGCRVAGSSSKVARSGILGWNSDLSKPEVGAE